MIATLQQTEKYLWKIETNRSGVKITGGNLKTREASQPSTRNGTEKLNFYAKCKTI